jgi:hypothetical protein
VFESTPAAVRLEFPDLEFDGNTFVLFELEIVLCCVRLVSQLRVVSLPLSPNWSPGSTRLCSGRSLHLHSELELELLLVFLFLLPSLLLSELCSPPEYPSHLHKLCTIYFSVTGLLKRERERVSFNYLDTPGTKKSASGALLFWLLLFI